MPRFVRLPENEPAFLACVALSESNSTPDLLLLHGLPGVGKSCLVGELANGTASCSLSASTLPLPWSEDADGDAIEQYEQATWRDLLVIEDLQHLPDRATETVIGLLDYRHQHGLRTVITANAGPAQIVRRSGTLPARLAGRLAAGLVVGMSPPGPASRRLLVEEFARRHRVELSDDIRHWLAKSITGCRQLEGSVQQIGAMRAFTGRLPTLEELRKQFEVPVDASRPTIERIVNRVSAYFRIQPRVLPSPRRHRTLLVPRQISMYLARRLTGLSLQQIGACLGGRDHTTVLHACRKIETSMRTDTRLSGIVRQLQAELA